MNLLVCGGRTYGEREPDKTKDALLAEIELALDVLETIEDIFAVRVVTHGNAAGGDRIGQHWCHVKGKIENKLPALWMTEGKRAGPTRNQRMLDKAKPDLVLALPGGNGTADMVARARDVPVRVIQVV